MQGCVDNGNIVPSAKYIKANIGSTAKRNKNGSLRYSTVNRSKRLEAVPPRPEHSTSVVIENCIVVCPVDKATYANPLYTSSDSNAVKESKAVQATVETDAHESSYIATNVLPRQRSTFGTGVPNRGPVHDVLRVSNSYSSISSTIFTSSQHSSARDGINSNTRIGITRDSTAYQPKPPRYPDYISSVNRQSSFQTSLWSVHTKPEVNTLTEYGFFFTGNADLVRCFQCGIDLKDWVKDDDVLAEHIKHSVECGHLYQMFGKTEVERLKRALTGQGGVGQNAQSASNTDPPPYKIRTPRYQTMEARVSSFTAFPPHLLIDHRTLAVAGLFYTGTGDLCRCFTCDGGLKDWSTGDDPIKEHATYFPHCSYINQLKGQEYITRLQSTQRASSSSSGAAINGTALKSNSQTTTSKGGHLGATSQGSYHAAMSQQSQNSVALSMDKLSIESNPSGMIASQLFQQLGYSELDVISARAELERQGNKEPSSEDIVNALLDFQERTTRQADDGASGSNSNDLKVIVEENERLLEMVQCMLCVTGEPDILFLPCAHHRICHDCTQSLTHCPVCQTFIREKVKTYRS